MNQSAQLGGVDAGGWAADNIGWRQAFTVAAVAGISYSVNFVVRRARHWRKTSGHGARSRARSIRVFVVLCRLIIDVRRILRHAVDLLRLVPNVFAGKVRAVDDSKRMERDVVCAVGGDRRNSDRRMVGRPITLALARGSTLCGGGWCVALRAIRVSDVLGFFARYGAGLLGELLAANSFAAANELVGDT